MAEAETEKLYTLTEVSKLTGISMPTLQRYKKLYQDRIPSRGSGRSQRYLESSLQVFKDLKKENIKRRGRPKKNKSADDGARSAPKKARAKKDSGAKRGRKKSAGKEADAEGLLTLTQIGKLTGISYPTLLRYVRLHLKEIPHKGTGRSRRYLPEAVEVFKRLRAESPRGRAAKSKGGAKGKKESRPSRAASASASNGALATRIKDLEKSHKQLEKLIVKLEKQVSRPFTVTLKRS